MARWRTLAVLAALSALLLLAFREDEEAGLALMAVAALSVGLAGVFDHAFALRSLTWRDAMLLVLTCLIAYPLLGVLDGALASVPARNEPRSQLAEWLAHWLQTSWGVLPSVPLFATALFPVHPEGTRPPLWPLAIGLIGSLGVLLAGAMLWMILIEPMLLGSWSNGIALGLPSLLGEIALVGGIAIALWLRAIGARGEARFPAGGIYRRVTRAVAAALALGFLLSVVLLLADRAALARDPGIVVALALSLMLCAAWWRALWLVRAVEPAGAPAAILAVAALLVMLGVSFVPPQGLIGIEGWVVLIGPIIALVTIGLAALVLVLWPRLARALLSLRL